MRDGVDPAAETAAAPLQSPSVSMDEAAAARRSSAPPPPTTPVAGGDRASGRVHHDLGFAYSHDEASHQKEISRMVSRKSINIAATTAGAAEGDGGGAGAAAAAPPKRPSTVGEGEDDDASAMNPIQRLTASFTRR